MGYATVARRVDRARQHLQKRFRHLSAAVSINTQMDSLIPPSKISGLTQGIFVGSVSDNFKERIEQKIFHAEIVVDSAKVNADEVVYEARGLYHPFLGQKAVRNDFCISDQHYYIVTGANMAGKSTLLRSIGINYVLPCCGMPVFAVPPTTSPTASVISMPNCYDCNNSSRPADETTIRSSSSTRF